jgi:periplasmic protein TonB
MVAIRGPFSALGGALFAALLFFGLWQLVDVPMVAGEKLPVIRPELMRVRPPTPIETRRDPPVQRELPLPQPGPPKLGTGAGDGLGPFVRYTPPQVEPIKDDGGFSLNGVDGDVIPRVRVTPDYPPGAIANNIEGWVQVRFTVTPIGTVRDAIVVASEPGTVFDEVALKAIARWRYNPRVENGEAVERVGLQTVIRFELEN